MPLALFSPRKTAHHSSLRRAAGLGLGLLSLLSLTAGQSAFAAPVTWNGPSGADWFFSPTYWSNSGYPMATDNAQNNTANAMTLGQSTTISSFFSSGAFTLTGGQFSGSQANAAGTITVNNVFTDNGGQINNFTVNQGTGGSLVFTGNGNFLDNDTINSSFDLSTNANTLVYLEDAVTENGAITLGNGSGLQLYGNGASLTLGSMGSLSGFGTVSQNGATTLINNGTVNANSAANALNLNLSTFNNNATAEATGGTLNLTNTINNAGLLTTTGGGILNITGTLNSLAGNSINGLGGTVNINGATLNGTLNGVGATSLVFNSSGGNIITDGSVLNANLDLATNADALLYVEGTVAENNAITLGTTSNGLQLYGNGANLTLSSTGSLSGFGTVSQNGATTLINNGTVNANSAANALNLNISTFNNNATTEATGGGTLNLTNTINNAGLLTTTGGGILNITGTLNSLAGNSINGLDGTININGATLTGTVNGVGATSLVFNGSGNNVLADGSVFNANLDLATNANAFVYVEGAATENKMITLGTTSNGIQLYGNGSSLTLGSMGSLSGFGTVSQNGATTLINNGTVNASSSGNALNLNISTFTNNATAEATGGTLAINSGSVTQSGTFAASGNGSVIALAGGTVTGSGSNLFAASNGGQIQINGETLNGTINGVGATSLVFNGSGNNVLADGSVFNANLDLATNANAFVYVEGAATENKMITLGTTSNGIQLYGNGANLTLSSTGSLSGFGTVSQNGATTLINNGTVNANSVGNTLTFNQSNFTNTGTTEVQNGAALNVTSANTDSGNILVAQGGTATFTQGVTQTAGLTQVDGTLNSPLTLTGGTLKGTGTINGAVVNNGGTVAAGDSPGTLTIAGPFTQAAGGTLDAQFDNATASLLSVSGLVTTGGFLDVNYIGSGAYTGGSTPFTFLSYGSLATSISSPGQNQYFSNETFDSSGQGLIAGNNGFTYELLNNTAAKGLQLEVLNNGAPVPEASTTISFGLLLLGGAGLLVAKRRRVAAC